MAANSPETANLEDIYRRALADQTDLYVVYAGPNEKRGWGSVPLSMIECDPGVSPDSSPDSNSFADFDPQAPRLLTYQELDEALVGYRAAVKRVKEQRTDDLDVLTGVHGVDENEDLGQEHLQKAFLRQQVHAALEAFDQIRKGLINHYRDYVGLDDDGFHTPTIVTAQNVDTHEAGFRRQWSNFLSPA